MVRWESDCNPQFKMISKDHKMIILGGRFKDESIRTILLRSLLENDISDCGFGVPWYT